MGRIVDDTALLSGDLLLTRYERPDWVSDGIARVQATWQPEPEHHRFTHAMMYLGAGFALEATFEFKRAGAGIGATVRTVALAIGIDDIADPTPGPVDPRNKLHGVFVTPLWRYGEHYSLRARRARAFADRPSLRQEMVADALSMYTLDHDFELVRCLGMEALVPRNGLPLEWTPEVRAAAVVCSTFYARAYDMTLLEEGITTLNGHCSPSFLSANGIFDDVPLRWAAVG